MAESVRTVTVLFTDIVGSTELAARLGPSAGDGLRRRHFGAMRAALAVHHGSEVKTLGDGLMAVFDAASEAVACAVTMQQSVAAANRRDSDSAVAIRVGLSAGEATCTDDDYFGTPVIEASRLCEAASGDQVLTTEIVRMLIEQRSNHALEPVGERSLKGLPGPRAIYEVIWDAAEDSTLRVAIAEDSALLRDGIVRLLESESLDVVLQAPDADVLLDGLEGARPHVVLLDVRMPPTHTVEGLVAAERIRAEHPEIGVIVLSQAIDRSAAERLLRAAPGGIGYLLKERVADAGELAAAIRTVASGGSVLDPAVATQPTGVAPDGQLT